MKRNVEGKLEHIHIDRFSGIIFVDISVSVDSNDLKNIASLENFEDVIKGRQVKVTIRTVDNESSD